MKATNSDNFIHNLSVLSLPPEFILAEYQTLKDEYKSLGDCQKKAIQEISLKLASLRSDVDDILSLRNEKTPKKMAGQRVETFARDNSIPPLKEAVHIESILQYPLKRKIHVERFILTFLVIACLVFACVDQEYWWYEVVKPFLEKVLACHSKIRNTIIC